MWTPLAFSHWVTVASCADVGANISLYCAEVRNCPYWALDGSLTAAARESSLAPLRGVSHTCAVTCWPPPTSAVLGATAVQLGLVPARLCRWFSALTGEALNAANTAAMTETDRHSRRSFMTTPCSNPYGTPTPKTRCGVQKY